MLPARVYTVDKGREHYSMTVVDYTGIEKMGARAFGKMPSRRRALSGSAAGGLVECHRSGLFDAGHPRRARLRVVPVHQARRDRSTHYLWNWEDLVEGHEIHLTNHADQSRTMAFIAMRENKLYMLEGTVPKGYPEPGLFYQSLGWVDKDGNGVRYQQIYVNEIYGLGLYPEPGHGQGGNSRAGRADVAGRRGAGAAGQAQPPRADR